MESCRRHSTLLWAIALSWSVICINVFITSAEWHGDLSDYELASFDNPDILDKTQRRASKFNHLTLSDHGDVYVGAVNWLYRLDGSLEEIQNVSTCNDSRSDSVMPCQLTNNYNKILVVDSTRPNSLITCGGVYDGICQLRQLQDIRNVMMESVPYVAGFEGATTVGLVAPGEDGQKMLYVVVTYTGENTFSSFPFPAISRRDLRKIPLLSASFERDSVSFSSTAETASFRIRYVLGLVHGIFTYFVASQSEDMNSNRFVSKISRVCQGGPNLDAYTEITLQCSGSDGSVYSLVQAAHFGPAGPDLATSLGLHADEQVLYAVFAKNQGAPGTSDVPIDQSALCVYTMTDILAAFREAVRGCIQDGNNNDNGPNKIDYLEGSFCRRFAIDILDRYLCIPTTSDNNTPLFKYAKGIAPVPSTAILELPGTLMSSIITTTEVNYTIALIGTSRGNLLKVHMESNTTSRLYERISVDTSPVLPDVKVNESTRVLFLLTEQKLVKLRVENCGQYTTCETCIGTDAENDGDPYCGWCTLGRRCTRYSDCPSPDVSTRWLAYNAAQCINITDVAPYDNLPITVTEQQITLTVQQLPDLGTGQSYECHFESFESPATKNGEVLECTSPPSDGIPDIPQGDDAVHVDLGVESSETSVQIIDTDFYFYECSTHTSCVSCVGSRWACDWCVFENRCTHESSTCTRPNEIIITGDNNPTASAVKGPEFCPQLLNQTAEVLLPNDIMRSINITTKNLPDEAKISSYQCSVDVDGSPQAVNADRNGDRITCQEKAYTYLSNDEPEMEVGLSVSWTDMSGVAHILDDIHGFDVTLYKCEVQKPDCSRCVTARPALECVWCGAMPSESGVCKLNEICRENRVTLDNGLNCPDPVLSEVFPLTGPIEGNTVIDVMGTDIGRRFEDVVSVMVGDQSCDLAGLSSNYQLGASVSCRTRPESVGAELVTLTVTGADGSMQHSSGTVNFNFKDPVITSFQPRLGPEAGGTAVSVNGTALNTGRDIEAFIGDNPCIITSPPVEFMLECTTPVGQVGYQGVVKVSFDGAMRTSSDMYTYTENPTITEVSPLKSINSGGRILNVTGTFLNTSGNRQIVVTDGNGDRKVEECQGESATEMRCPSPNVTDLDISNANLTFGFIMDGVTQLLTWSQDNDVDLKYFDDPVYYEFEGGTKNKEGETLTIMGKRIKSAITAVEIKVTIGEESCDVNLISEKSLVCELPDEAPAAGDFMGKDTGKGLPVVWVRHNNLQFRLGYLVYPSTVPLVAILVPSLVIPLSMAILLAATFVYCKQLQRKRTHDRRLLGRIVAIHLEIDSHVKRRRWYRSQKQSESAQPKQKRIVLNNKVSFVPDDIHIDFSQLELGETLGQGAFGRVLKAVLHDTSGEDQIVAVKTVQDTSDPKNVVKFLEEGLIMKTFDHVNVLGLLGLTFDADKNPLVVIPFMANGDLKTYLVKKKQTLATSLLMRFASHAALGMSYLAQHKFVHRDLAARNCMVNSDLVVKIADFGLSRDMHESDYYTSGDVQAKLPIKWMAPESMERRVYNARTDVWSYGVLLWEIFGKGSKPYPGIPNQDVYDFLKSGQRMAAPKNCPPEIYGIMVRCWQDNPKSRCTFVQVANELKELLEEDRDYVATPSAGVVGMRPIEHCEEPGVKDDSYLVPMQQETAFGADGPCSDGETSGSHATAAHDPLDYVNKIVIR
ncbi:plexin-B-like [Patiria miniata]|uniref:Hepatocyte growth factor receptor n=1 Tax=Patiria miniata TaxID=46514 RepID=A0A914B0D6_PATMI|nr:plexin-B-like [Patiria miniata]